MTDKPIRYWRNRYLLHARSGFLKRQVERSKKVIREFLAMDNKPHVSISGGKDSTVLMHLVWSIKPDIKFVSEKDDMDFPEEMGYMEGLRERYNLNLDIISPPVKLWDVITNHDFLEDIHSKGTSFSDKYFYDLLKKYKKDNGYNAVLMGLRAKESKQRLMNFKKRGYIYYNKQWQEWVCNPLSLWTATDIFAYLFMYDIPILPVYFKTMFVDSPEDIRKSWILPSHQSSQGQVQWIKHYYPEIYLKLCEVNPLMSTYT